MQVRAEFQGPCLLVCPLACLPSCLSSLAFCDLHALLCSRPLPCTPPGNPWQLLPLHALTLHPAPSNTSPITAHCKPPAGVSAVCGAIFSRILMGTLVDSVGPRMGLAATMFAFAPACFLMSQVENVDGFAAGEWTDGIWTSKAYLRCELLLLLMTLHVAPSDSCAGLLTPCSFSLHACSPPCSALLHWWLPVLLCGIPVLGR